MRRNSVSLLVFLVIGIAHNAMAQKGRESPFGEGIAHLFSRPFFSSAMLSIRRPSWDKRFPVWFYYGGRRRSLVRVGGPVRGQGALVLNRDQRIHLYFPAADLLVEMPPMMGSFPLFGSDFSADDLFALAHLAEKFTVNSDGEESLSGIESKRYRLAPRAPQSTIYAAVRLWVSRSRGVPLREEFISERGVVVREVVMEDLGVLPFPARWHATTFGAGGGRSELAFRVFERNPPVSPELFTVEGLRRWR